MKILDLGSMWGMDADPLWDGWKKQFKEDLEVIRVTGMKDVDSFMLEADLVYFGGGADIHPSLYGHRNVASGVGHMPSQRDVFERLAFNAAKDCNIPIFGICRGAQLVCALSGGALVQDVQGHAGPIHMLYSRKDENGRDVPLWPITSTHHQMMYVSHMGGRACLVAYTPNLSKEYVRDENKIPKYSARIDPEIVYFRDTRALAVQGHPEYMDPDGQTCRGIRSLINEYCLFDEGEF